MAIAVEGFPPFDNIELRFFLIFLFAIILSMFFPVAKACKKLNGFFLDIPIISFAWALAFEMEWPPAIFLRNVFLNFF